MIAKLDSEEILTVEECEKLFNEFLHSETEAEVTEIINKYNLSGEKFWHPYGNETSNYTVIGNQSSSAEGGLAEKDKRCRCFLNANLYGEGDRPRRS